MTPSLTRFQILSLIFHLWISQYLHQHSKQLEMVTNFPKFAKLVFNFSYVTFSYIWHFTCHTLLSWYIFLTFQIAEDCDKLPHFQQTLTFLSSEEIPRSHSLPLEQMFDLAFLLLGSFRKCGWQPFSEKVFCQRDEMPPSSGIYLKDKILPSHRNLIAEK